MGEVRGSFVAFFFFFCGNKSISIKTEIKVTLEDVCKINIVFLHPSFPFLTTSPE